ncbi:MAG: ABC transporter permease subunit [Spirochaetales bacterium]
MKSDNTNRWLLLGMALPAVLLVLVFAYGPILGWAFAFSDYRIGMAFDRMNFVGFKAFEAAFTDPSMYQAIINTLAMSLLALTILPAAASFAILVSELRYRRYGRFLQTIATLPNFMSWVIVFSVFSVFLSQGDGVVNNLLQDLKLTTEPINFLGNADLTWTLQTFVRYWKELGYSSVIFFAALAGLDPELYEAAKIDGAGRWATIKAITIPGLMPTFLVLLLINIGSILSSGFDQYYVFWNGMVSPAITTLDYYTYAIGLKNDDIPYATAVSVAKTVVSVALVFLANSLSKKLAGRSIV